MTYVTILLWLTVTTMVLYGAALARRRQPSAGAFGIAALALIILAAYRLSG